MSSLVVGGLPIRIQPSPSVDRFDGTDRASAFDNSYRVSVTGGVRRDFHFTTPPVSATDFAAYMAVLSNPSPQICSGDVVSIPTMCCAEAPTWSPVRSQGANYYIVNFTLHEVQAANVLLRYAPGDVVTGESFTRSTTAYQLNASGLPVQAAINAKRDAHYIGGVRSLLLEGTRTNSVLWASDCSNVAWTKVSATIATGIADPTGGTGACTVTASAGNGEVYQHLADAASAVRTNSVWLRRRTGTGTISFYDPLDANPSSLALTSSWQRFAITGTASVLRYFDIVLATSGDAVDLWCAQQETGAFATSEIPTTTVAVPRGADLYSLPFTTPPQEMTVYVKFNNRGTVQTGPGALVAVSSASTNSPYLVLESLGTTVIRCYHYESPTLVSSDAQIAATVGDTCEVRGNLFGDGSVLGGGSLNSATETVGTQSAANPLSTAWSGPLCWLNSEGTGGINGFVAIQSFKLCAGARSLSEMRAA